MATIFASEMRDAFHHAHLVEVKKRVVFEHQIVRDLALDRELLEAINVGDPNSQGSAAMKVAKPLHTALAKEPRVVAVVVPIPRRVHEQTGAIITQFGCL
jgi:hypothetical protein